MKMKIVWNKEAIQELCILYESKPNLYCTDDPDYKNKIKRSQSLHDILDNLMASSEFIRAQSPTIDDIKTKIHGLRTQFFKEFNKIKSKSNGCGDEVKQPTLWCFSLLEFLITSTPVRERNITPDCDDNEVIFMDMDALSAGSSNEGRNIKKRRIGSREEDVQLLRALTPRLEMLHNKPPLQDDIQAFGRMVMEEMKKINPAKLIQVKRDIFNCLMNAQENQ